jgi:transcriptional regulator with XRE-family HTH domain
MLQYIATNARTAEQYFADHLYAIRTAKGMTQAAVAAEMKRRLGGDKWVQQTVQKIEKGTLRLRLNDAVELASILDTDLATMIGPTGLDAREVRALIRRTNAEMANIRRNRDRARGLHRAAQSEASNLESDIRDLTARSRQLTILLDQLQAMLREGKN